MENQSKDTTGRPQIEKLTRELQQTNAEIERVLERLPLSNHDQVARLGNLVARQKRLMRTSPGTAPAAAGVFLDNARHSARYLQMRYADAKKNGRLRKSNRRSR